MRKKPIVLLFLSIIFISPFTSAGLRSEIKGKFDGRRYELLIYNEQIDWDAAKNICIDRGGKLAEIFSQEENNFIRDLLLSVDSADWSGFPTHHGAWIGMNDKANEGIWLWNSGQDLSMFENFGVKEPNNQGGNEDCGAIETARGHNPDGWWNDGPCSGNKNHYPGLVCKYNLWIPPSDNCLAARDYKSDALAALRQCKLDYPRPPWYNWKLNCSNERVDFHACVELTRETCPHGNFDYSSPAYENCIGPVLCAPSSSGSPPEC